MKQIFCLSLLLFLSPSILAQKNENKAVLTPSSSSNPQSQDEEEISRLNIQVVQLYQSKKYAEAIALAKKAFELSNKRLGQEHKYTIAILNNLARIYFANGNNEEAASRWRDLLKIYEKLNGKESEEVASVLNQLGMVSTKLRDYESAQKQFKRALEIRENIYGSDNDLVAQSLLNLGQSYLGQREYKKAEPLLQRVLEISERVGKENNEIMIQCLDRLAMLFVMTDRGEDAVVALLRADSIKNPKAADSKQPGSEVSAIPISVKDGILNGRAIYLPKPAFPLEARRTSGTVGVQVTISETGKVIEAKAISGPQIFYDSAIQAARQARFLPTIFQGRAVKVTGTINYGFVSQ